MTNLVVITFSRFIPNLQPVLSGNPFLLLLRFLIEDKSSAKKIGSGRRIKLP